VPRADIDWSLDHLVGASRQRDQNFEAKCLCGLEIDDKLEFGRQQNRQIGRLLAPENARAAAAA
jgi:hypothetical protein